MSQIRPQGATPASASSIPTTLPAQVDLLVSLHLHSWPALTLAVQNGWGGDRKVSSDKRDWFAGAVSELLVSSPPQIRDLEDLEEVLIQVMLDEFEIVVDDGSAQETAEKLWGGVGKVRERDMRELKDLYAKFLEKQAKGGEKVVGIVRGEDKDEDETDWDDEDEEEWSGFEDRDVDMDEAPQLIETKTEKQKVEPEIDEDGFTKVISKKNR